MKNQTEISFRYHSNTISPDCVFSSRWKNDPISVYCVQIWLTRTLFFVGGQSIQEECSVHMRTRPKLLPGSIFVSSPGRLPCQAIIHSVGPRWKGGQHSEVDELFQAITRSLEEADRSRYHGIAIPVLSSGIYGFPIQKATDVICEAVVDYIRKTPRSTIQKVHLMDNRLEAAQSLKKSMEVLVPQPTGPPTRGKQISHVSGL